MKGINKPKYGGDFTKKKYWKLKDGESTFRILPGLGENDNWSKFYKVHYGYRNTKGQLRPFVSPLVKNNKTKMIEVPDAALERIEKLKGQHELAKKNGDGVTVERIDKLLKQYNLDSNHYVNAMDTQGNIGVLKLRHRAKLALDATIKRLQSEGIDPLSADQGRFFIFRRSGNGLDTTFQVDVLKEKINVPNVGTVEKDVVSVLNEEIARRLFTVTEEGGKTTFKFNKEAADLNNLFKTPTSEQVARIVKESEVLTGKSKAVDELLENNTGTQETSDEGDEDYADEETTTAAQAAPTQTTQAPAATVTQSAPVAAAQVNLSTPPPAAPQTTVTQSSPTKTTAQTVSDMSEADFLKSLGLD